MIYPPQISFIPVNVALTRFIEAGGGFFAHYPYWYLGTTPFNYLTGPVVPGFMVVFHKIFPFLTLFDIAYLLIIASFIIGALGWGLLAREISGKKSYFLIVTLITLVLPW